MTIKYLDSKRIRGSSTGDGALGSGLKAYYKFDESTGNIVNVASTITGNSTIGTGANIVFAGTGTTTYEVTGTPTNLGNAVTLPQTTTTSGIYGTFGDSTTDFDFMWSGTPKWTMCFWAKQSASAVSNTTLIKNNNGEGTKGFEIYWYGTSTVKLRFNMTNGSSGNPAGRPFNAADFADFSTDGDWHFYSYVMDGSLGSNQLKVTRDGGTTENFSKTSGGFAASGTSYSRMSLRTTYASIGSYVPPEQSFCELMIFDTVLTDAQLTRIYNAGAGRLLSNAGTTDEKATLITDIAASSPNFDEDYGTPTYTWTQTGSNITVAGGFAYMNNGGSTDGHRITAPLGVTLSDSTWVADFDYKAGASTRNLYPFLLTAGTSIARTSNQDMIGVRESNASPRYGLTIISKDGSGSLSGTSEGDSVATSTQDTWYYCRLKRTASGGSDNVTLQAWSTDALRTAGGTPDVGTETATVASTVGGLTTIQHAGDAGGGASSGRTYWIDNTKIYNTITTPVSASSSTNLPENTLFDETDTRETYFLQDNTGISKAGCLGWWKFQEQTGNVINHATTANGFTDGLGSAADAVLDAGLKRDAVGKFRPYAYEWLDTGTLSLDVPNQTGLSSGLQGDITITMWVYPTADYSTNGRTFMSKRDATTTTTYQLYYAQANTISYYMGTTYNSSFDTIPADKRMVLNTWNFVAASMASNELTIYLNGYKLNIAGNASDYTHTVASRSTNSAPLTFGQTSLNNAEEYAGRIQDSTIWNRALSEAELTFMYNSGHGIKNIASGVAWY